MTIIFSQVVSNKHDLALMKNQAQEALKFYGVKFF